MENFAFSILNSSRFLGRFVAPDAHSKFALLGIVGKHKLAFPGFAAGKEIDLLFTLFYDLAIDADLGHYLDRLGRRPAGVLDLKRHVKLAVHTSRLGGLHKR